MVGSDSGYSETHLLDRIDAISTRLVIGIIALVGGSACGLIATFAHSEMVEKMNMRLSKEVSSPQWDSTFQKL